MAEVPSTPAASNSDPTEFRSWKIRFKATSRILRNTLESAMLWIGEVEDGKSIHDLITSASIAGRPILDFENLDC